MDWFWTHRLLLALAAQKSGWTVYVAVAGASATARLREYGFVAPEVPIADQSTSAIHTANVILAIARLLSHQRPALVHAITLRYAFMAGIAARFSSRVPLVFTIAGLGYLCSAIDSGGRALQSVAVPLLRLAFRHSGAAVIFQNADDQQIMIQYGLVHPQQAHLIRGSGVDLSVFKPEPEPVTAAPLVLMPSRLVRDKGIETFVTAARLLAAARHQGAICDRWRPLEF